MSHEYSACDREPKSGAGAIIARVCKPHIGFEDALERREAVNPGQADIEYDQIRGLAGDEIQRLFVTRDRLDLKAPKILRCSRSMVASARSSSTSKSRGERRAERAVIGGS